MAIATDCDQTATQISPAPPVRAKCAIEATVDGEPADLGHARQRAVLAALLVEPNRPVSTGVLTDRVWGDRVPSSAQGSLHSYVSRLRKALAGADDLSISRQSERSGCGAGARSATSRRRGLGRVRDQLERERLAAELDHNDIQLRGGEHGSLSASRPGSCSSGMGVDGSGIPAGLDARTALWRAHTAGKRLLIVLDNAADSTQIRPLLPGPGSVVIVTSRARLRGLVVREGARQLRLDRMPTEDALEMLRSIVGPDRVAAAPGLLDELGDETGRLAAFDLEDDEDSDLRSVFLHSYKALGERPARLFRLLGAQNVADFTAASAAAVIGITEVGAAAQLDELVARHLVAQPNPGRYQFHDLMRDFARTLARETDSPDAIQVSTRRLLGYYLSGLTNAGTLMNAKKTPLTLPHPTDVRDTPFIGLEQGSPGATTRVRTSSRWSRTPTTRLCSTTSCASRRPPSITWSPGRISRPSGSHSTCTRGPRLPPSVCPTTKCFPSVVWRSPIACPASTMRPSCASKTCCVSRVRKATHCAKTWR